MEGAIVLLVLLVIIIFLLPVFLTYNTNSKVGELRNEIAQLKILLKQLQENLRHTSMQSKPEPLFTPVYKSEAIPDPEPEEVIPVIADPVEVTTQPQPDEIIVPVNFADAVSEKVETPLHSMQAEPAMPKGIPQLKGVKTNLEKFIAEKLLSLIGIGILVLGIFFTVKWAISRNLISDGGKVLTGLLAGSVLVAVAHRLSKNYRAFSSILAGGGIAVFYFAVYESFQAYHLVSQQLAFACMILISVFAVILSIVYDKKELAIIAIVGGFASPFLVSTGSGNYKILFSYMLILDLGMFVLAYYKKWNLVHIVCYGFTILIFSLWLGDEFDPHLHSALTALLFACLFYMIFFGMIIIYNVRKQIPFKAMETGMLLSNSFLFLGTGLYLLKDVHAGDYQGMFTIALSVFNFIFAYIFYKQNRVDKNLIYLLIALVLTFISLAGPLQLDGNYITLFWASEMLILYWLGMRSGIQLMKHTSAILLGLTAISLCMDWNQNYFYVQVNKLPVLVNKAFITSLVVITALIIKQRLVKKEDDTFILWGMLRVKYYAVIVEISLFLVLYLACLLELQYQVSNIVRIQEFTNMMLWLYQYLFFALLFVYTQIKKTSIPHIIPFAVSVILTFWYFVPNAQIANLRDKLLINGEGLHLYFWHYAVFAGAMIHMYLLINYTNKNYTSQSRFFKYAYWYFSYAILFILSAQLMQIWVSLSFEQGFSIAGTEDKSIKIGMPILWAGIALTWMLAGMRNKIKTFRIISLVVFTVTIAKLFIYDISNVSQGGKIAAFVILGIVLLTVSFLYQKIKGIFTEEEKTTDNN